MSIRNVLEIQDVESEKFSSLRLEYKETITLMEVEYCYYIFMINPKLVLCIKYDTIKLLSF